MNIPTRIENIKTHLLHISKNKVGLAFELLKTKRSESWASTSWMSWKGFCSTNVALSMASVYVYTKTAEMVESNKFTETQANHIVQTIGWERFRLGLTKIGDDEIISGATFIGRYKNLNLNERITYDDSKDSGLVNFSFNLPADVADLLNAELVTYGMRTTNRSRSNMSAAMIKLVKEIECEF